MSSLLRPMGAVVFLTIPLLVIGASASCGSSSAAPGFSIDASTGDAIAMGANDGAANDSAAPADAHDSNAGDTSTSGFSDAPPPAPDAATCTQLNIGILGNPGANASSNFQQWLITAGSSVQRIQTTTTDPLTLAELQVFDVVVLDELTRDYTTGEAALFQQWIMAGGGAASMSGYTGNTTVDFHANSLLAPLEVAYSGALLNGPVTTFATHPVTMGLTSVTFEGGYAVSDLGGSASVRTPLATIGSTTVAYAVQMGSGHAFVWGDEWIEFNSEWSTNPQIQALWVNVFKWVSPTNKCGLVPR